MHFSFAVGEQSDEGDVDYLSHYRQKMSLQRQKAADFYSHDAYVDPHRQRLKDTAKNMQCDVAVSHYSPFLPIKTTGD